MLIKYTEDIPTVLPIMYLGCIIVVDSPHVFMNGVIFAPCSFERSLRTLFLSLDHFLTTQVVQCPGYLQMFVQPTYIIFTDNIGKYLIVKCR